jgi:Protein of unknown function (DUF4242)
MEIFIDRHRIEEIDPAARRQLQMEADRSIRDVSGTLPLGHWVEDGAIFCLLEAPDEDSICQHHRDRGVPCEDPHALSGITGVRPLSGTDRLRIAAAIRRIWHAPIPA